MDLSSFSIEQALKLTKHPKTSRDALKMSKPAFWIKASRSEHILWAKYKGKSIQTYQCRVALKKRFYFHCNCSSKLQPCRHALALLILFLDKPTAFKPAKPADAMLDWWSQLSEKEPEPKKAKLPSGTSASLPKRLAKMKLGILELDTWLQDVMRQGLSNLAGESQSSLESIRQRLTDAGLGGLRGIIDEVEEILTSSTRWPELILPPLARLKGLSKGLEKFDELKPIWQKEILLQCGVYVRKEELEALPIVEDQWAVLWTEITERADGGHQRKAWLYGQDSARYALLLEFNFREPKFVQLPSVGRWFKAALTYYPSPYPLRALLRWTSPSTLPLETMDYLENFEALQDHMRASLKMNPWQRSIPIAVNISGIYAKREQILAIDHAQSVVELQIEQEPKWKLLAISQDFESSILLAEYDGLRLRPIGLLANEIYYSLSKETVISGS